MLLLLVLAAQTAPPSLPSSPPPSASASPLRVCVILDAGFEMLVDSTMPLSDVTTEADLRGYSSNLRKHVLSERIGVNYTLHAFASYGRMMVATRMGDCDVAWAPYFAFASREACTPDPHSCRALSEIGELATTAIADLTPYRCCVDFSQPFSNTCTARNHPCLLSHTAAQLSP